MSASFGIVTLGGRVATYKTMLTTVPAIKISKSTSVLGVTCTTYLKNFYLFIVGACIGS